MTPDRNEERRRQHRVELNSHREQTSALRRNLGESALTLKPRPALFDANSVGIPHVD